MKSFKKVLILAVVCSCAIAFTQLASGDASAKKTSDYAMPQVVTCMSFGIGSTGNAVMMALSDAMMKRFGIKIRIISGGNEIGRIAPARAKKVHLINTAQGCWWAWMGRAAFAMEQWGPQDIYMVWQGKALGGMAFATAADANIKTPYDVKGKRVSWIPYEPGNNPPVAAFLAYAGYSIDDVKKVVFPGYVAAIKGLVENKTDLTMVSAVASGLHELVSSPRGIHWPSMPGTDKEEWDRFHEIIPYITPTRTTGGIGMDSNKLYDTCTYPYPIIAAYGFMDEEFVYNMCKMIDETYDLYKDTLAAMRGMKKEEGIKPPTMLPFHKGAIRYFKDIGYWTPEMEAANNNLMEKWKIQKKWWDVSLKEAALNDLKGKDLSRLYLKNIGFPEDMEFIK